MINHLRHMAIFCQIVDSGSISQAALVLELSKSVISEHLKALELTLDVQLLQRTTRTQQLTPAGRAFYTQCTEMTSLARSAWSDARESSHQPAGEIRLTAPHALMESVIAPAISKLIQKFPGINPRLEANDQRIDMLSSQTDLAIRVGPLPSSNHIQSRIGCFRDILCVSADYRDANKAALNILYSSAQEQKREQQQGNVHDLEFIANAWQTGHTYFNFHHRETQNELTIQLRATRHTNTVPTAAALARSGAGIAMIPDFLIKNDLASGRLINIFPDWQLPEIPVYSFHAYGKKPPLVVKLCSQAIKEALSGI